jgi:hypothetical protein
MLLQILNKLTGVDLTMCDRVDTNGAHQKKLTRGCP